MEAVTVWSATAPLSFCQAQLLPSSR